MRGVPGPGVKRGAQKPLCACGCKQRCKSQRGKYATVSCVPRSVRSAAASKGRKTVTYRARAILFRTEIERLTARGQTITRETLLEAFKAVHDRAYQNGYHAAEWKWTHRERAA